MRRQIAAHPDDESRVFFSDRAECTAANINAWGADSIHVNHLKALLQLYRNPFIRPHGKVMFTVHGIHLRKYDFLPKTPSNRLKRAARLRLERMLYKKCDRLTALTDTDATEIHRLYGKNLAVSIEPNTIDPASLASAKNLRYGADAFAFACIARFDFQKGQDILIDAIALAQNALRQEGKRTLFIGDGPTLAAMKEKARKTGIEDLTEFAGEIPRAGVYMTCARTLIAPSRWEGMPYLLLEAVARRRRIVASGCPGNIDILQGYSAARLFQTGDAAALAALLEEST